MIEYPEHEKLQALGDEPELQGRFLEWLGDQGLVIAGWDDDELSPVASTIEQLLAEYHEIDLQKISDEKDAMLAEMRARNDAV